MTDLWDSVLQQGEKQRAKGMSKYGKPVTADETEDWLQHAIEEHLDAAVYLEAAKSVLQKLAEANSQLSKECEDWLKMYADESTALAESRKQCAALQRKVEELTTEAEEWMRVADDRTALWEKYDKELTVLRQRYQQLEKQRQSEEESWAATAKVLRKDKESADTLCNLLRSRLRRAEKQTQWACATGVLIGIALSVAVTLLL